MYNYSLNEPSSFEYMFEHATAGFFVLLVFICLVALAIVALLLVSNCFIFKKAGEKPWKGLIPLYNSWIETKIAGLAWWWFPIFAGLSALLSMSKSGNFIVYMGVLLTSFNYNYNLAKKFGKSNGFAFLCTILPFIGLPILAFGSAKYNKDVKVDKNGIFSIEK